MRAVHIDMEPFEILSLTDFESKSEKNQHGYAKICGYISDTEKDKLLDSMVEETWVRIRCCDEDGEQNILFCGYLEDVRICMQAGTALLTAVLKTGTGQMDLQEHIRVYQGVGTSYEEIQQKTVEGYMDGSLIVGSDGGRTDGLLVQYKETDWEFAKRMASKRGTVLLANEKSPGVKYTFGIVEEVGKELPSYESYSIVNRVEEYQRKKAWGMTEHDAIAYKVKSREIIYLGDSVYFMGRTFIVGEVERKWEGNELYNYYLLETAGELTQVSYGNKKIIGASLTGIITEVKKDTVKVVVSEDESGGWAGSRWFPYATVYSSPDGTGWYCMPEPGDRVRLYFPNENEEEAYVNSSVNESSSNAAARSNPDEKSMRNKQGKEVLFKPDRLILTNNKGMSIEIVDDEGIRIESDKSILIKAKESIGVVSAEQGVEIAAPEKITLKQGETILELEEDIKVQGDSVNIQ